jgi:cation diffusion facilitator family transporter
VVTQIVDIVGTAMDLLSGKTCTLIGLLGNIILTALKFAAGVLAASPAMVADATHSLSDVVATAVVYLSLRISAKPPDREHQLGHGHAETLSALFVGLTLFATAIYIGYEAVINWMNEDYAQPGRLALAAAAASIVVKEAMFRYTLHVGKKVKSSAIVANAWDHRSDAYSSLAALIGIVGASYGYPFLDPAACLVIAGFIAKVSVEIFRENIDLIMGVVPDKELKKLEQKINSVCRTEKGVLKTSLVNLQPVGAGKYHAGLVINVPAGLSVSRGHAIAARVRQCLLDEIPEELIDVLVHVAPGEGYKGFVYENPPQDLHRKIKAIVANHPEANSMHDLSIYHLGIKRLVTVDIEVDKSMQITQAHKVAKSIKQDVLQMEGICDVVVHIDHLESDSPTAEDEEPTGLSTPPRSK